MSPSSPPWPMRHPPLVRHVHVVLLIKQVEIAHGPGEDSCWRYAAESLIPSTTELGGKSPNIFFADVMDEDDAFLEKAVEGPRDVRV